MRTVWVVEHETQRCAWIAPPVNAGAIDISEATVLGEHDGEAAAIAQITQLLERIKARATWADVRPWEQCAKCGEDFKTSEWHSVIALMHERQDDNSVPVGDPLSAKYAARFCPSCSSAAKAEAERIFRERT